MPSKAKSPSLWIFGRGSIKHQIFNQNTNQAEQNRMCEPCGVIFLIWNGKKSVKKRLTNWRLCSRNTIYVFLVFANKCSDTCIQSADVNTCRYIEWIDNKTRHQKETSIIVWTLPSLFGHVWWMGSNWIKPSRLVALFSQQTNKQISRVFAQRRVSGTFQKFWKQSWINSGG